MRRTIGVWVTYAAILSSSTLAIGETLEQWKTLESVKNCAGVPYSTLRDTCHRKQEDVHHYCKSPSNPFSCDDVGTKGLMESIEGIKKGIEKLVAEKNEQKGVALILRSPVR